MTSLLSILALILSSVFASVPVTEVAVSPTTDAVTDADMGAPICPDTLCYHEDIIEDAYSTLESQGFMDAIDTEVQVTFLGYIDAPTYDGAFDYETVQVTDNEGTTYVFAYSEGDSILA